MMSDQRPDADTCRDCGRTGRERDGCNCIRDAFNDIVRTDLAMPRPGCECKCVGGVEPHADRLCRAAATTLVALHRWGFCDEPPDAGGVLNPQAVDTEGNLTSYMCERCADHAVAIAKSKIKILMRDPDQYGIHPTCPTCGRHTMRWQDILERRPM